MIGTIRKHSALLWWSIIPITILSFVWFMGSGPVKSGSGSPSGSAYGIIYGHTVTLPEYVQAQNEFSIFYWVRSGQWPKKGAGLTEEDIQRETYIRLLMSQKAAKLGIEISEQDLVTAAGDFLHQLGQNGRAMPMQQFVQQYLAPQGLTVVDLQNFLRGELILQQLMQTIGVSGALVTPQEVSMIYDREHQEVSAQAVFFSASNYLAQATVTPAAVGQFYTNNMAAYRQPDRVQVSYVAFEASNYLAQAKAELEKTNFTEYVDAIYQQYGPTQFPDAKTPEEAKAQIREQVIHSRALNDARQVANDFAAALFAVEPVKAENLASLAKQKGLAVRTTAPFDENYGPNEINVPAAFTKAAFQLSAEEPFAGPVIGQDAVYVFTMAQRIPSSIPPLAQIRARVTQDLQAEEALALARRAGTNFYLSLTVQMAAGKTFAQSAVAAAQTPMVLTPFSLSTSEMPEVGDLASPGQMKQAAFTTTVGHISNFTPTQDGGFVMFVQEMLPVDGVKKNADLPQFTAQVRRARQNEAFNVWLQGEANRELRDTPLFKKQAPAAADIPAK